MARRRNYDNSYNRNSAQSRMFSVSANNPYAFQNQFVGKAGSEAAQEKEDKKQEEFKALQEERRLREEKLKDLSRTYIDQFPPGADVSDASKELGSIITQEMTTYRNDYGQLAIGYPKAEIGSEQSGTIKAGMDEVISNANSLNNQVASWTEMKKDILQKASTSDYKNQFSRDAKNQEVAEELLKVFTGDPNFKAEIRDGKIGYQSTQQNKFVTIKEMQRMLPFGKAYDYVDDFMEIRTQVMKGEIQQDSLEAFTFPLRSSLDGEEGLRTALSLATDDVLLPGFSLMSQTEEQIDAGGVTYTVPSMIVYDTNEDGRLSITEVETLMKDVYSGKEKAKKVLKDEIYDRLKKTLTRDADNYQKKLTDAATAEARLKNNNDDQVKVDSDLKNIKEAVFGAFSVIDPDIMESRDLNQTDFDKIAENLNKRLKGTGKTVRYVLHNGEPMIEFRDADQIPDINVDGSTFSRIPFNRSEIITVISNLGLELKNIPIENETLSFGKKRFVTKSVDEIAREAMPNGEIKNSSTKMESPWNKSRKNKTKKK